jgi:hypothetical protein
MSAVSVVLLILAVLVLAFAALVLSMRRRTGDLLEPPEDLSVSSPAFENGAAIPRRHTGRGEDVSPALELGEVDPEARSISVIMDDHDHPFGVFNHWLVWNIPATKRRVPEGIPRTETVPALGNAVQGKSAYGGKHYYRGPLPPFGTHRYVFKVYVLDTLLELPPSAGKADLQRAMRGHVLQYGTLSATYGRGSAAKKR